MYICIKCFEHLPCLCDDYVIHHAHYLTRCTICGEFHPSRLVHNSAADLITYLPPKNEMVDHVAIPKYRDFKVNALYLQRKSVMN